MDEALALENHWLACMAAAGGGAGVTRTPGALVVVNPAVSGAAFNFIALRGAAPAGLERTLELGGALLAAEGRAPAVFLSPAAGDMARLTEALQAAGWQAILHQSVLTCTLPVESVLPPGVAVHEGARLDLWAQTLVEAYEVEPVAGQAIASAWTALADAPGEAAAARFYLAEVEGRPAGTGLTWMRGGVAGLYCGAVLPAFRRRGVERATVLRRLADAALAGCYGALVQTETGSPVEHLCVDRLGFRVAYRRELWVPRESGGRWRIVD